MSTIAVLTMTVTMLIVTAIAAYFFVKVLRTPPKSDSYLQSHQQRKE